MTVRQFWKKTEKQKRQLITNVSHDLRSPLTSIIGYVTLIKQISSRSDMYSSGLGLAIAKRIVELHRGRIDVRKRGNMIVFEMVYPED